ncbi:sialic acid-binding Ig-like lectin 12 isoform X2 [Carassius carassius]|uniref:sialic acid-binding Ig-like lectin 12 isoform X2 n=1 Tax=Carassius carassius TaxID=217509 RepID=UPI0028695207|nr:sialic acid-binding Ig-like lectin 12 isoform X2 [Carassius carassius]
MDTAEKIIIFCFLLEGVCCRDFNISLPQKIKALIGSCVIIKCRFEIKEEYDEHLTERATGVWYKDGTNLNRNVVFNSSTSSQKSSMKGKIIGKLKDKDCTTIFYDIRSNHSGQYFFRIESEGRLKHTYIQANVSIDVIESPPKPRVQLYVEQKEVQGQEEVLEMLEGSSVSLRCSAETLCSSPPPTLTWSSTPRILLNESSRLQDLISNLNFTATHREHGVTFTCTITYQLQDKTKTAQDSITLHVQYSPKNTAVSVIPSSSVLEGSSVTLVCSSDANPAVIYTWSRESEGQLKQLQTGDTLTFNRTDPTHRGWYHCTAQNQHGSQNSSVKLDIQSLNHFSLLIGVAVVALVVMLLSAITCICVRKGNGKLSQTTQKGTKRSDRSTSEVAPHENQDDPVYVMMSSAGAAANQDSIIYSSIVFTKSESQEFGSLSSPDYAVKQDCSEGLLKTESSIGESSRAREAQVIVSANVRAKEAEEELFEDSSQIYAKVKRHKP